MPKSAKLARAAHDGTCASKNTKAKDAAKPTAAPVEIAPPAVLKRLADTNEEVRLEALKTVTQKLKTPRSIESFELQKLWKGLWFTMWHSDKPLVQQALARDLASLVAIVSEKNFWPLVDAYWFIVLREWETLDQHRVNKYLLLVRFMLNSIFTRCLAGPSEWVSRFAESMVESGPLNYKEFRYPLSLRLHLADIYIDELEKVFETQGIPDKETLALILKPVLSQIENTAFKPVKARVLDDVLTDERLVEWGVLEPKEEKAASESEHDDWEGFE